MGLFDIFRKGATSSIHTKDPGFVVTNFTRNTTFQGLIESRDQDNFFDQYILYVYKCIDLISNTVASQDITLVSVADENVQIDHDISKDLSHFNNYMNLWEAVKLVVMHKKLTGAAFWVKRESQNPGNKWDFFPLDPTQVDINTDEYGLPRQYRYQDGNGEYVDFEPADIVYFREMDPSNWFEGYSPLKAFRNITNTFNIGSQFNMNKLNSDGMPDFFLWFDGLSKEEKERAESALKSKYMGAKNAKRQGILSTKQKPELIELSKSQKDLDFVEGMKMMRQDILALFGVPEALVFPSSTNANTKESLKIFQQQTIKPILDQMVAALNEQLLPTYFGDTRQTSAVKFIYANPVDQDKLEQSVIVKNYTEAGFTLNEALELAGMETIDGGDVRRAELTAPVFEAPEPTTQDVKIVKEIAGLKSVITDTLVKDSKELEREKFKMSQREKIEQEELRMLNEISGMFISQASATIKSMGEGNPQLKNVPKAEVYEEITKNALKGVYTDIMAEANDQGNVEIRKSLLDKDDPNFINFKTKSLTPEIINQLNQHIDIFAKELSETTLKDLKKVVAQAIEDELDVRAMQQDIADLFNNYVDGASNVKKLKEFDVYVDAIELTQEGGVVASSGNRYNAMLERITQLQGKGEISKEVMNELLTALKGVIDKSDPVGASVDTLLTSIYGINERKGITAKRAETIARTESTYARNLGLESTYADNPFVKGLEWMAIGDGSTRDAHAMADGQVVPVGTPFVVGGQKMKYPGDGSLGAGAANIVNCRCRIVAKV